MQTLSVSLHVGPNGRLKRFLSVCSEPRLESLMRTDKIVRRDGNSRNPGVAEKPCQCGFWNEMKHSHDASLWKIHETDGESREISIQAKAVICR